MRSFFIIDVESIGLHGDAFAVAGGVYLENGVAQWEFGFACPTIDAKGTDEDRQWVADNIPMILETHRSPKAMRDAFWNAWIKAKAGGALMAAECSWPVEARFLEACVADDPKARNWEGPYPLHDVASVMLASGMDPMATYERTPSEMPKHDPLADARQSARLLAQALAKIG